MAEIKGTACLLKIGDSASPEVFTTLEGQQDTSFDGSTTTADTTAKDNAGWETAVSTTINGTTTASGVLRDSRANLDLLEAAWLARTTINAQVLLDNTNGYQGAFYVTNFNISGSTQDVVKYNVTLSPAAALTAVP